MGMCTYVIGFKPRDEKFNQMQAIFMHCRSLGISIPKEVDSYFEGYEPDENGVRVDNIKHKEWCDSNSSQGIEINLDDLPPDVKIIRFVNSY